MMYAPTFFVKCATSACTVLLAGCSISGNYGYSVATGSVSNVSPSFATNSLTDNVKAFLQLEIPLVCRGKIDQDHLANNNFLSFTYPGDDYSTAIISGLHSCVTNSKQWERLQITFTSLGESKFSVTIDGWAAPGIAYPSDSQFTNSISALDSQGLAEFTTKLIADYQRFLSGRTLIS